MGAALSASPPEAVLDLGSGGGIPGLVLSLLWEATETLLLDASRRRTDFLRSALCPLGLSRRVRVLEARAEDLAREETWRESLPVVVARGFGPPAVTAECASGLLRPGGVLVVSEPPHTRGGSERWPVAGVSRLGLRPRLPSLHRGLAFQVLDKIAPCPDRYPRRPGIPAKRPLFGAARSPVSRET